MTYVLPLALLAVIICFLAAMPWRRADPQHEFIFDLCKLLPEDTSDYGNADAATTVLRKG
jgi:hypothetical protein